MKLEKISINGKEFECAGDLVFCEIGDQTVYEDTGGALIKVQFETYMTRERYRKLLEWLEETKPNDE
ncbi:MAG: hypothetical protein GY841_17595 [FCB group bacterium]|nr:hypothetical protein [FCB group bacterium]